MSSEAPPDQDGFLSRQCPACSRQFKMFADAASIAATLTRPGPYSCPYYGSTADGHSWWTPQEIENARIFAGQIVRGDSASASLGPSQRAADETAPSDWGSYEQRTPALSEPNDRMMAVVPACHPSAPLRVYLESRQIHCTMCGGELDV
jgi:hypothetical protein